MVPWCCDMGIAEPAEEQADLRDLAEVAHIVREAFFAMLERDHPGAKETLQQRVWAHMQSKHARQKQDAQRKRETPPQPPSVAKRDRTMFSHCIFNLEDRVLDCIDAKLRALGWCVASLLYDGVRSALQPSAPPRLSHHAVTPRAGALCTRRSCTFGTATAPI